ncbi:hypothetical protein GDO81_012920 [Engystomops pustulosus]|uniref:alpha-N-acetylgalactosaminide alpha-2,6-sialyltransferase n=1 Tax=Engystomops pustulosus TaxID=76066 RepID=A0AAV7B3W1_ENGPU|nr:hypothetical protein GDO81_012920 [Engystomops pustulosus]
MKFFRLKTLFLVLAHVILIILLLLLFFNSVTERLYPKRAGNSEAYLDNEDEYQDPVNLTEDLLSYEETMNEQPGNMFWDSFPEETTNGSVIGVQELKNQTQREANRTSLEVRSTTFGQTTWKSLKAKDFTAEPQWESEEHYIQVSSSYHTTCPISIRIKAYNVPWLKQRFLYDITIFMDSHHFSDEEWKRLGHFIPPFGWMELKYSVVKEAILALPDVTNQQLLLKEKSGKTPHCVTCAVVGNGGILNASRMGQEIDAHDYVFRVNGAVIQGYEDDVGRRTSFYGFTAYTLLASLYMLNRRGFAKMPRDEETKYILFTEGQRDYEWLKALQQNKELAKGTLEMYRLRPRDDFGDNFDFKKLLVVHPDFARYLKNRYLRSNTLNGKGWRYYRPTTGALVLLTALHLCDTVSAYGFMTEDFKNYADHYYDKTKTNLVFYVNHDFLLEKDLWALLHEKNIIKLYMRAKGL